MVRLAVRLVNRGWATVIAIAVGIALLVSDFGWIEFTLEPRSSAVRPALLAGCILIAGLAMDWSRAWRRRRQLERIEEAKLRALRVTMRTVQHVVNTFLNDLILLEVEAANILPQEMLDRLDDRVQEIAEQLKALGDVKSVREKPLGGEWGVDYVLRDE